MPSEVAPRIYRYLFAVKYLPQWFVALFAVVYLSGYLVDFFFCSSWGISETAGDLLRLRYIQIGISVVLCYLILAGPSLFAILRYTESVILPNDLTPEQKTTRRVDFFLSAFRMFYLISIYAAFLFIPSHYFRQHRIRIWAVVSLIFIVLAVYIYFDSWIKRTKPASPEITARRLQSLYLRQDVQRITLCCGLAAVTLVSDYFIFEGVAPKLIECLTHFGFVFILFCILFGTVLYRMISQIQRVPDRPNLPEYSIGVLSLLLVIFYLSLVSYTNFIFPYVPSAKGGADFANARLVRLELKSAESATPSADGAGAALPGNLIIVYSTSLATYFADTSNGNSACKWRTGDLHPKIIQVQQSAIKSIEISPEDLRLPDNCETSSSESAPMPTSLPELQKP